MKAQKIIYLTRNPPRPPSQITNLPLYRGLILKYFIGYFSLIGFCFTFVMFGFLLIKYSPEFFWRILLSGAIGCLLWLPLLWFLKNTRQCFYHRKQAILHGVFVKGKILDKQPLIRIFLVKIAVTLPNKQTKEIKYLNQNVFVYNKLKIGDTITGLWDQKNDFYFFPFEINYAFVPKE